MYLKKFLAENRSQLNEMILNETNIHPLIVDVGLLLKIKNMLMIYSNYYDINNFLVIIHIINRMST